MPLYDYECPRCGEHFEEAASIIDRDTVVCKCGAPAIRILTGGSFLLRGCGWSKPGHINIVPPQSDPTLTHDWKTRYYNCTPEDVHKN
jgi:putative FmdB family regulatory protein